MSWKSRFPVLFLLLALFIWLPLSYPLKAEHYTSEVKLNGDFDDEEYEIFDLINRERRKQRLAELKWDDDLAEVARRYSKKMARERFFDHFDKNGKTVADRTSAAKIKNWRTVGENLFYCECGDYFSDLAVRGWMKSPTHRANIVDREWTETGIGIARARNGDIYVTQVFLAR